MSGFRRSRPAPRHVMCRRALRGVPLHVPAGLLTSAAVADWVRRRGLGVDVSSAHELEVALGVGLRPAQISAHCRDAAAVDAAVGADVGRFVVGDWSEVLLLRGRVAAPRALVDVSDATGERLAASVVGKGSVDVVGLRCHVTTDHAAVKAVSGMVDQMRRLREAHGVILTRVCLSGYGGRGGDVADLRQGVHRVQLAIEDACARWRYPRPALMLSLDAGVLVGPD